MVDVIWAQAHDRVAENLDCQSPSLAKFVHQAPSDKDSSGKVWPKCKIGVNTAAMHPRGQAQGAASRKSPRHHHR
jgi:hypothetical protein